MERPGGIAPPSAVGLMSPARFRAGLLQRRGGNHLPCVPAGLAQAAGFEPAGRILARANRRFNSSRLDLHIFDVYHPAGVAFGTKEGELADDRLFGHAQPRLASAYGASDPVLRHVFFSFACIVSPARQKVLYTLKEGRSPLIRSDCGSAGCTLRWCRALPCSQRRASFPPSPGQNLPCTR